MDLKDMSKAEKSLLLFFECAAVDYGGTLQGVRMNAEDFDKAKQWNESGFISFGRIAPRDHGDTNIPRTNWVVLSEDAWRLAHEERRARCQRMTEKLTVECIGRVT